MHRADVDVNHFQLAVKLCGAEIAEQTKSRRIDEQRDTLCAGLLVQPDTIFFFRDIADINAARRL